MVRTGNQNRRRNGNAILAKLIRRLKNISAPCGASVNDDDKKIINTKRFGHRRGISDRRSQYDVMHIIIASSK